MGVEEDHQLHKTEEAYLKRHQKHLEILIMVHTFQLYTSPRMLWRLWTEEPKRPFPMTPSHSSQEELGMRTKEWHPPGTSEARVQKAEDWKEKKMQAAEWIDEHT